MTIPLFVSMAAYVVCTITDHIFHYRMVARIEHLLTKKYMLFFYGAVVILVTILNNS